MAGNRRHAGGVASAVANFNRIQAEVKSAPTFGTWEKDRDSDGRWMVCCGPDTAICRGIKNEADADLIVALHAAHVAGVAPASSVTSGTRNSKQSGGGT